MNDYHTSSIARPTTTTARASSYASSVPSATAFSSSSFDRARASWTSTSSSTTTTTSGVGRARTYSKKSKKNKKAAAAAVVEDDDAEDDDAEDDEDGEDGAVEYDPKQWEECVHVSFDFLSFCARRRLVRLTFRSISPDVRTRLFRKFKSAVHALDADLSQLRTSRASQGMIDHILVDVYGEPTPLAHLGTVTTPNATTLSLTLYDAGTKAAVEKAILNSPLGLVPKESSDGLIIPVPAMTQDTRKEVCKMANKLGESAKIASRNIRHKALKRIKSADMPEDDRKRAEKRLQQMTDDASAQISAKIVAKEKEIMAV